MDDSSFSAKLRYDFLKKLRVQFNSAYSNCIIEVVTMPFVKHSVANNSPISVISQNISQYVHNSISEATDNAGDDMFNYKIFFNTKLVIQPKEQLYAKTVANIIIHFPLTYVFHF